MAIRRFEIISEDLTLAVASDDHTRQPDILYMNFILCHEGPNLNGDYFTREILKSSAASAVYKPIDVEHKYPTIGVITSSEYIEPPTGLAYIKCSGMIWKYFYPKHAEDIQKAYANGGLKMSMECYFKHCDYLVGNAVYSEEEANRLHISELKGASFGGAPVYRRFKDVIFGGAGVVRTPADRYAVILSVASQAESLKTWHDLLHFWYEHDVYDYMSHDDIVKEHQKVTDILQRIGIEV